MKLIEEAMGAAALPYPIARICRPEQLLFMDIETTGLSSAHNFIYLIGCSYYREGQWRLVQWFAEQKEEEKQILTAFLRFSSPFSCLLHFNGNVFDLPFLAERCRQNGLAFDLKGFRGVDLYRRIFPYRFLLQLPNCKQRSLEKFLGIERQELYGGGELIEVYYSYIKEHSLPGFQILLLHNAQDLSGMLQLTSLLSYTDLFQQPLKALKVQANYYKNHEGIKKQELLITLKLPAPLPLPVTFQGNECYFKGNGGEGLLRIPLASGPLKYFYANYRDYYYLPEEDMAVHKSVASFVSRPYRVQATAATCYTQKSGLYLPQWDAFQEPFFKRDYKDGQLFFELTASLKTDRLFFGKYASYVLQNMAAGGK